ncbi:Predicted secreted hydrolase [Nitrosomonas nitrosa]|jgi:predicted secreted hydrolase|uniref:Predicted secreted hydrolase n=1 Tax=Nitrosomonas nitrosa TaxID=52442 RepID=A0A1I4MUM1_9PROT|nr:lipocalin-like domain-containing protein [Nitrosomonas nitrosa]SFM06994.1 Predicted secreted hydrolase [Nitrosomonas nitrosa]
MHKLFMLLIALTTLGVSNAAPPEFTPVTPRPLVFPEDFGSHEVFRIEWWYVTGWLETSDQQPLGFQVTFFRSATSHDEDNPSRFAPKRLIVGHAALSDPKIGKLLHAEKSAREGFGLAYAKAGDTDVKLDDWYFVRQADGRYRTYTEDEDFTLELTLTPSQPLMLQDLEGFSRKGPKPEQASYYYSEPHLQVSGTVTREGKNLPVKGSAWLDHEWSSELLHENAVGWDWASANLDDGSALMVFQIRGKDGQKVWAHAGLRDASGNMTIFSPDEISFHPIRTWRSPHTDAEYPVEMRIKIKDAEWVLTPLMDDQELDSRQSTNAVYWEGAVTFTRDGQPAGRGYLELTGYFKALSL